MADPQTHYGTVREIAAEYAERARDLILAGPNNPPVEVESEVVGLLVRALMCVITNRHTGTGPRSDIECMFKPHDGGYVTERYSGEVSDMGSILLRRYIGDTPEDLRVQMGVQPVGT